MSFRHCSFVEKGNWNKYNLSYYSDLTTILNLITKKLHFERSNGAKANHANITK
ncbi:hypothetical protein PSFL107428_17945 [Pseudoalteromonas maricaloris]